MKKLEPTPAERNRVDVKLARKAHVEWLIAEEPHLIYIDESGFNLWTHRTRGRSQRGQRAQRVVGARRCPNFTLILAVSSQRGRIYHSIHDRGTTAEVFNAFQENLLQHIQPNEAVTLLLDNAPCHRRAEEAVAQHEHVSLRFLPAYSPFLNIAENCFSVWKAGLRRQLEEVREQLLQQPHAEQMATLTQLAELNLGAITPDMCMAFHRGTRRTFPACIQLQDVHEHA